MLRWLALASLLLCTGALAAADPLAEKLQPLISAHKGKVAVVVKHLKTGASFTHNPDEPMPTASLIKFPVMIEAFRQAEEKKISLDTPVALREADKVPGSGILTANFSAGASFPLRDAVRLMIVYSDNTATNLVLDQIGLDATAKTMEKWGYPNSKIHSKVFKRETSVFPERSRKFGLGSTTANEMVRLFEALHEGKLVSPAASKAMTDILKKCDDKEKFTRLVPPGTSFAFKTGSVDASRTAAGILYSKGGPIALCVLTNDNEDKSWRSGNAGDMLCAKVALVVFEHFKP